MMSYEKIKPALGIGAGFLNGRKINPASIRSGEERRQHNLTATRLPETKIGR
jgi:hypothetical protein